MTIPGATRTALGMAAIAVLGSGSGSALCTADVVQQRQQTTLPAKLRPQAQQITRGGEPAQLDVRPAGEHSIRITLKPIIFERDFPFTPVLDADRTSDDPVITLREIDGPVEQSRLPPSDRRASR